MSLVIDLMVGVVLSAVIITAAISLLLIAVSLLIAAAVDLGDFLRRKRNNG